MFHKPGLSDTVDGLTRVLIVSVGSRADFQRQILAFKKRNPNMVLDETSLLLADAAALRLDSDPERLDRRLCFEIPYTRNEM